MSSDFLVYGLLLGMAWTTTLSWVLGFILTVRGLRKQRPLALAANAAIESSGELPLVSVLVPARNEEHRILRKCLRSISEQDYPRLEIIAVNDRSVDATGEILRQAAAQDSRLLVIEGVEPPPDWLGKPHALAQAFGRSRGEWVLATDADMLYQPQAVRTALDFAQRHNYDALTLLPHINCESFWERVFMPTFGWFMLSALPVEKVNDPARVEAIGVGGFFLIRREALQALGGYEAVRDEVVEDIRMAELLKSSGARLRLEYAPDLISTRMQTNLREIWEGFTKNLFAGTKFSPARTVSGAIAVFFFAVLPIVMALVSALMLTASASNLWPLLLLPTSLTWALQITTFGVVNRAWGVPLRYALTVPLGHALFLSILLNSALKIMTGRGVTWKGRKLYDRAGGIAPPRNVAPAKRSRYRDA